jgi:hypothetical protein
MWNDDISPAEKREIEANDLARDALNSIKRSVVASIGEGRLGYSEEREIIEALNQYVDARVRIVIDKIIGSLKD